jgi:hypothetical protein
MRLCNRHVSDDGTSISVWCSHTALAAVHGNQVRTRHQMLMTPELIRRKK